MGLILEFLELKQMKGKIKFYQQTEQLNCGPTCLRILLKYYGKNVSLQRVMSLSENTREGSTLYSLSSTAEDFGLKSFGAQLSPKTLAEEDTPLPCILHWQQFHYVVLYKVKKNRYYLADPAVGKVVLSEDEFLSGWIGEDANLETESGIALFAEPTPRFYKETEGEEEIRGFGFLYRYLWQYKKFLLQLVLGVIVGSIIQLIFPFLTQSVVDVGIQTQDLSFIYLILLAQLFLFLGQMGVELIRAWILLHLSTRINISLISDFIIKLTKLPIAYFDSKLTGDLLTRVNDHQRIENLLANNSLNVLFSLFNIIIFGGILAWYSHLIFLIYLAGSSLYLLWVFLFMRKRKALDYRKFEHEADAQDKVIELLNGMQEIKMHNAEREKRWNWEYTQTKLFKVEVKNLSLEQTQTLGTNMINELTRILIMVIAASLVINGSITLGGMLAITYLVGQINGPTQQLMGFLYTVQDAKIALERLAEIHNQKDEKDAETEYVNDIEDEDDIVVENLTFCYPGAPNNLFEGLNLTIPAQKMTAIVGTSGSGKTTLMKVLLKFYDPQKGIIKVGPNALIDIEPKVWRDRCGVVMQEGFIFNDSIQNNIAIGHEKVDRRRLMQSLKVANIEAFVEALPLGLKTKIGQQGVGISTGQKQRILIARAFYKQPEILFFDEATSALDALNEKTIMENLEVFFKKRTVVMIAHRLSTVKNADQIVLIHNGKIIEQGTHKELISLKGSYYNLVKNQLELDGNA